MIGAIRASCGAKMLAINGGDKPGSYVMPSPTICSISSTDFDIK
jgi:hypothetical protein